jgi:YD repeat-containing protein
VIASVDPLGNCATVVYDAASQLIASVDPLGNRTTTAYDARGNIRTVTDPLLNVTTATFDAADRLVALTDPLNCTSTSVYDTTGRVIASIDPRGNRTTAVYDPAGRLAAQDTARIKLTGDNLREYLRLADLWTRVLPGFQPVPFLRLIEAMAANQASEFAALGLSEAVAANSQVLNDVRIRLQ